MTPVANKPCPNCNKKDQVLQLYEDNKRIVRCIRCDMTLELEHIDSFDKWVDVVDASKEEK